MHPVGVLLGRNEPVFKRDARCAGLLYGGQPLVWLERERMLRRAGGGATMRTWHQYRWQADLTGVTVLEPPSTCGSRNALRDRSLGLHPCELP